MSDAIERALRVRDVVALDALPRDQVDEQHRIVAQASLLMQQPLTEESAAEVAALLDRGAELNRLVDGQLGRRA